MFHQAVSVSDMPKLPPGSTRIAAAEGWAMTLSGTRGVLNDALSIYFADATLANAFVARWCVSGRSKGNHAAEVTPKG